MLALILIGLLIHLFSHSAMATDSEAVVILADSGYVNVREKYGAKGDGKTDDTAAFAQAAKDTVPFAPTTTVVTA
jgi:polygalacturonase